MPSEWAKKTAQGIARPLKDRIYREMSAKDYDETWDRIAEALDAARIEGLEEAAKIVENAFNTTGNRHEDTYCCIRCLNAVLVEADIRKRIEEVKG